MFTGIVEEVGRIGRVERGARSVVLHIQAKTVLEGTRVGDSIAVNGVCLTVTSLQDAGFSVDVMHETLERSSLATLNAGSSVNLERAMPADGRFGGHIVSGHIDACGTVAAVTSDDNAVWYHINAPEQVLRYVVEKGSIAIDGISLTVARVDASGFSVSTIPHTNAVTTLGQRKTGDTVNLECDVIGKYVERLFGLGSAGHASAPQSESHITMDFLAENGF